jgi:hypothetical protein
MQYARAHLDQIGPYRFLVVLNGANGTYHELPALDPYSAQTILYDFCRVNNFVLIEQGDFTGAGAGVASGDEFPGRGVVSPAAGAWSRPSKPGPHHAGRARGPWRTAAKIALLVLLWASAVLAARAEEGYATFFSYASCLSEGTSGITASGRKLQDGALWCAWPVRPPFIEGTSRRAWGRPVRVTNLETGKEITVYQMDVGPGRRARARGVIVDLTPAAFAALGGARSAGRLRVAVEVAQ